MADTFHRDLIKELKKMNRTLEEIKEKLSAGTLNFNEKLNIKEQIEKSVKNTIDCSIHDNHEEV